MEVDESSSDAADQLIYLESPSFLHNLGAAGGEPEFPQQVSVKEVWHMFTISDYQ